MSKEALFQLFGIGQFTALAIAGLAAIVSVGATALAFAGVLPWPEISLAYAGQPVAWAGPVLQVGVTAILVTLALSLPSARRVLRLELSHRRFEIGMDDVTRAYRAAHMADRSEIFGMVREFDAVRERYQYLRHHPELAEIDAELLTMAAQMSEQSRQLAETFSDAKVARARESLLQRRKDADELQNRIQSAFTSIREIRRLIEDVDIEECAVAAQMQRLREELDTLDGFRPDPGPGKKKVAVLKSV